MAWDAGAITGKLGLDISEFAHGMLEAQAVAAVFPSIVVEFMENPLLGLIQVAKEAASSVREAVEQIGGSFDSTRLMAEKAGVGVEYFSRLSAAAERVGISAETLGGGFKFLQERMAAALEGDKQSQDGFARLGLSLDFVRAHIGDTEGAFSGVLEAMGRLPSNAARVEAAMKLMGRGGSDLVPLFDLGIGKIHEFGDDAARLGAVIGEAQGKLGEKWGEMEAEFKDAWTGIKVAVAEPILKAFAENGDGIKEMIVQLTSSIRATLTPILNAVVTWFKSHPQEIARDVQKMVSVIIQVLELMGQTALFVADHFDLLKDLLGAAGIGVATAIALRSFSMITSSLQALIPQLAAATTAQLAFNAARAAMSGAGVGVAASAATGGSTIGGLVGGAIGAVAGSLIGGPAGTYIGGALGGYIGGQIGNAISPPSVGEGPPPGWHQQTPTVNIGSVNVAPVDTAAAAAAIGQQVKPQIDAAIAQQSLQLISAARHRTVLKGIGGST